MEERGMGINSDHLSKLAETFLDDQGQVDVSVKIDEGDLKGAQVYLLGAIDRAMNAGELAGAELLAALNQAGLPQADIVRIYTNNAHLFEPPETQLH
jgi:hypothetical protein